ncbi:MAG: energy-coupled thiamine transporter ThiT [Ruminococcaceae bacterium]|nr:energy-coupled thiamine transporter ThiT [Oscillospiraceae bacterium]
MSDNFKKIRILTECAIMIALSCVLSVITIYSLPQGGSITAFCQVPIIIISYRHGLKWGAFSGFVLSVFQLISGLSAFSYVKTIPAYIAVALLDYIIAFTVLGFGGMFRKKIKNQSLSIGLGAGIVSLIRLLCHFLSGVTVWADYAEGWKNVWIYSLAYNGSYMGIETAITVLGVVMLGGVLDFSSSNLTRKQK